MNRGKTMFSATHCAASQTLSFAGKRGRSAHLSLERSHLIDYLIAQTKLAKPTLGMDRFGDIGPYRFYKTTDLTSHIEINPDGKPLADTTLTSWARFLGMSPGELVRTVRASH